MKKLAFIVFTVLFPCLVLAQNLVPNPSFEDTLFTPNSNGLFACSDWFMAYGSPDLFHPSNTIFPQAAAPANAFGFQDASEGIAYAGLAYFQFNSFNFPGREYISVRLEEPLKPGVEYCLSFQVSQIDLGTIALSEIGAYLSSDTSFFSLSIHDIFDSISPQVKYNSANPIDEREEWIEVSGSFIAEGGEEFLSIGNFSSDSTTLLNLAVVGDTSFYSSAYYYLDHVVLLETSCEEPEIEPVLPNVFTPNNDGLNDQFHVELGSSQSGYLEVYNRWGQLVYTQAGQNLKWDGYTQAGVPAPESTYYVLLKLGYSDERLEVLRGTVQLLR